MCEMTDTMQTQLDALEVERDRQLNSIEATMRFNEHHYKREDAFEWYCQAHDRIDQWYTIEKAKMEQK